MGFLPKDYVGVHTRVEKFHADYETGISINTEFKLEGEVAIFKATVVSGKGTFTGSSFGELGKEKAFEKLETVAVGRALAFAGYEVQSGIASGEEMEVFNQKPRGLIDCINDMKKATTKEDRIKFKDEGKTFAKSEKQIKWLTDEWDKLK